MDIEQPDELIGYLRRTGRIEANETPSVSVLAGGVSNKTVWVTRQNGEAWVLKQALEKLRVAVDWYSDPKRVEREALGIRWLGELAPAGTITPLVFEDHENHLLAMRAVPQPHENWKTILLAEGLQRDHVVQFATLLGTIQKRAYAQRNQLSAVFDDRSFFTSLRIEPYYEYSATQAPEASGFLQALIADTLSQRHTLVHGDYSPKNVLVRDGRLILLDHEVIHFGDPAFDVGFALTHLLSKAHHLPAHRRAFTEAAHLFWTTYTHVLGDIGAFAGLEERAARHTLACLLARVAGRSQLEYLSNEEKARQRDAVLAILPQNPGSVGEVIERFLGKLP